MKKYAKVLLTVLGIGVIGLGVEYYMIQQAKAATMPPSPAELKKWQFQTSVITTNTQGDGMVQMQVTIQAGNKHSLTDLTDAQNQILDGVIGVVHTEPSAEFLSGNGLEKVKQDIAKSVRLIVPGDKILGVYLNQVVEQGG